MIFRQIRHATCLVEFGGIRFLVDPILYKKNTLDPVAGGLDINNPLTDICVSDEALKNMDAVLLTHTHRDHFDPEILTFFGQDVPIICSHEYKAQLTELGFKNLHLIKGEILFEDIRISLVKGQHGTGVVGKMMGNSYGFVLKNPNGEVLYITGDTVWCKCVEAAIEEHNPDVIIGFAGSAIIKNKHITLDEDDLKAILEKSKTAKVIAIHMDAWNHCRLTREILRDTINSENLLIPEDGETIQV